MPARCCAASARAAPAPATATPTTTASWCASIRWCCSTHARRGRRVVPFVEGGATGTARCVRRRGDASSPASAPARPIPTTSRRPSSSRPKLDGVDMVTVVTEGIFSYCGVKVKIDTDRYLGPEQAAVRVEGEAVGHVTTGRIRLADAVARRRAPPDRRQQEGGPRHLRRRCWRCATSEAVELAIDGGATRGRAGRQARRSSTASREERMRVGCGSADDRHVRASNGTAMSTR